MKLYPLIYQKAVFPLWHWVRQDGALGALEEVLRSDRLSEEQLREVERKKRYALLEHAFRTVPYWQTVASRLGASAADIVASGWDLLPVTTKQTIRSQGERLLSGAMKGNRLYPNSTSGSTGEPLDYFTDHRSKMFRKAVVIRNRRWIGVEPGEPVCHLWGSPIDAATAETWRGRVHGWLTREKFLSAYKLSDVDMGRHAKAVRRQGPELLIGYPSVLVEFGAYCARGGIRFPTLRSVICSAESLYCPQRRMIEESLGVRAYNRYGCREVGDIAHEAPGSQGLIVNSDRVFLEVLDDVGRAAAPGVLGHLVVTDLDNYGMPLIRYRIEDQGAWGDGCASNRPYPWLEKVEGRTLDVVRTRRGERIGGTFWTILFRQRPGIQQFQVVQEDLDHLVVRYVRSPEALDVSEEWYRNRIGERCGTSMKVDFERVDRIEPEESGKFRVVKSTLSA